MRPKSLYKNSIQLVGIVFAMLLGVNTAFAQTTSFTYQGRLTDGGTAANGNYDLQFTLWNALDGGTQQPQPAPVTVTRSSVPVSGGVFTVQLDFGATAFPGADRWLEISARLSGAPSFTLLAPRQPISSTPYAIHASTADAVTASGTLSGNIVNAATQYNLGGNRILRGVDENLFVGFGAGQNNTIGSGNSFFGMTAGTSNTGGAGNSFYGATAGQFNTTGSNNSFYGEGAGLPNTQGSSNSFFGNAAGRRNTTGTGNSFFGHDAGFGGPMGNQTGDYNSFFGASTGFSNTSGSFNTLIGTYSDFGADGLTNATAIGVRARVDQSNAIVLGSVAGVNGASASVNVGIGTTTPQARLDIAATGDGAELLRLSNERPWVFRQIRAGSVTGLQLFSTVGQKAFEITASDGNNVATFLADSTASKVGIGTTTPQATLDVNGAGVFRPAGVASPRATSFASPNGETGMTINGPSNRADVRFDGMTLKLVATDGTSPPASTSGIAITTVGNVGIGTTGPLAKLDIVGGFVRIDQLAGGGGETLCRNLTFHTITSCSSSSLRYKKSVQPLRQGLNLIQRLRPVTFNWKEGGRPDLGLIAEEVAEVEPLLTFKNDKGVIEGVHYDRLNIVLINAIKQQQEQIETLRTANVELNARLRSVEKVLRKRVGWSRRRR